MSDSKARWGSGFKRILDDLLKDDFEDDFQRESEALMLEMRACEKIKEEEKIKAMRETAEALREAVEVVANAVESARDGDKGRQERIPALMALMMRAVQMFYFDVQALGYDHAPLMGKESKGEKNA